MSITSSSSGSAVGGGQSDLSGESLAAHERVVDAGQESLTGEVFEPKPQKQTDRYTRARGPLPPMPRIGLPEETYLQVAHKAERNGDDLLFEAAKVGQYVSLAMRKRDAPWAAKLKYFRHALKRHCQPPEHADAMTKDWFKKLASFVKAHIGAEALRLAGEADDRFEARQSMGQSSDDIADDAERFFESICPMCDECPPIYNQEDWLQLKIFRDRWV